MAISRIFAQARETPDKTAVVHDGVTYTYAHFARWIEGSRRYLAAEGLPVGSLAVIWVDNLLEAWFCFGLRALGIDGAVSGHAAQTSPPRRRRRP